MRYILLLSQHRYQIAMTLLLPTYCASTLWTNHPHTYKHSHKGLQPFHSYLAACRVSKHNQENHDGYLKNRHLCSRLSWQWSLVAMVLHIPYHCIEKMYLQQAHAPICTNTANGIWILTGGSFSSAFCIITAVRYDEDDRDPAKDNNWNEWIRISSENYMRIESYI